MKNPLRQSPALILPCAVVLSSASFVACGSGSGPPTTSITMGVVLDRTSQTGGLIAIPDVVQFAIDDVNAGLHKAGNHKAISFTHSDGDSSGSGAATIAGQLATTLVQEGARLMITDNSNNTLAVMKDDYDADTTNDLNVPILCVLCGSSIINDPAVVNADPITQAALRNGKKWNFRVILASKFFAPVVVARALAITGGDLNHDGVFKAALYGSNEPQGISSLKGFEGALRAANPAASIESILHDAGADPNGTLWAADSMRLTDNRNETTNVVDGIPDIVYESSLPGTAIAFTKAYLQGGYQATIPLIHGAPFGNETATLTLGDLANGQEGVGFATYYPGASADFFIQRFLQHFGKMPESHERDGATTYDAIMLGALATMVAVKDLADPALVTGAQIRDAMWTINDPNGTKIVAGPDGIAQAADLIEAGMPINYQGVSGPLDFDENAFVLGAMAHWVITGNHFHDQQLYDCTTNPTCPLYVAPTP